jgi:hypothetical protein
MKTIFIICLSIICKVSLAQFNFRSTDSLSKNVAFIPDPKSANNPIGNNHSVDSIFRLQKEYSFQFRYWKEGSTIASTTVFILTLQNKKWTAKCYVPNKRWQADNKYFIEKAVDQTKLDQLWELMANYHVLTLPTQAKLQDRMVRYTIDTAHLGYGGGSIQRINMTDGILYNFQLIDSKGTKSYWYSCPQMYLQHFGNILELYDASIIILLIKKYLGLNDPDC